MKIIDVEQGTPEWLSWRKSVITATDCPAIMGSSPWVTSYKAWQRKLGLVAEQSSNEAMERGKRLEPLARSQYIKDTGLVVKPVVVESTEYNFLGASLDGLSDTGIVVEIKCGGIELHNMAMQGVIPEYYLHQMQHQLLVTGAEISYYYSYFEGNGVYIPVHPDPKFVEKYLEKAREWWKCIAMFDAPPMTNKDYFDMDNSMDWTDYATQYQIADAQLKALEEKKDYMRRKLIELCGDQSCRGAGIKVIKVVSKGRVDYERIPEIKGVNLDKYRKESSQSWKVTIDK